MSKAAEDYTTFPGYGQKDRVGIHSIRRREERGVALEQYTNIANNQNGPPGKHPQDEKQQQQTTNYYTTSSSPSKPSACLLVGAPASKYGFSPKAVTLVPCLGSLPS